MAFSLFSHHRRMKRIFKLSAAAQPELLNLHRFPASTPILIPLPSPLTNSPICRILHARTHCSNSSNLFSKVITLFTDKVSHAHDEAWEEICESVSLLREEVVRHASDFDQVAAILDEECVPLIRNHRDGSAFIELLNQLASKPQLAVQVFQWRRMLSELVSPMTTHEYAKGITLAGRAKNIDLAVDLFTEADNKNLKRISTYNALMGAYMYNGYMDKCQQLFRKLKKEALVYPSVVTYNILLSTFGRLMLVDSMEEAFRELKESNISPNLNTYNHLIAGYVTAWMWDSMENTFEAMKADQVEPDLSTYMLMLRGYAHSGNLEKMDKIYEMVKDQVNAKEMTIIRAMICAYCKSEITNKVEKIEELLRLIPEEEYRPWLNILMIDLYAKEDRLEEMEKSIDEAFRREITIRSSKVMKSIGASYFRCKAVDKLADFVRRAETAGWKICRCLYHCELMMYGSQRRLDEIESVLNKMEYFKIEVTKKTLFILYNAYLESGEKYKADQIRGSMYKHGYGIPGGALES